MKNKLLVSMLCVATVATLITGCDNKVEAKDAAKSKKESKMECPLEK